MPEVILNPLLKSIQGRLGNLVFVREGDHIWVRHKAQKRPPTRSPAQVAHTAKFVVASRWARTVLADPATRALYEQVVHDHLTPHNIAVRDFMHPPVVEGIELESYTGNPGDVIHVLAADDFRIVRVSVQILTVDRQVVEEGGAEWNSASGSWGYVARVQATAGTTLLIEAAAFDLPGNCGTAKAYFYVAGS
jgi:hypothetical protein